MLTIKEQALALATEATDYISAAVEPHEVTAIQQMAEVYIEQAIRERSLVMRDALAWIESSTEADPARYREIATQALMGESLSAEQGRLRRPQGVRSTGGVSYEQD